MAYNVIFPIGSNFPIVPTLLWKIKTLFWDTEIIFPNLSLSCLHLKAVSQRYKALKPSLHRAFAFLQ